MRTFFSRSFEKRLDELRLTHPKLLNKVAKQIKIFQFNPKHPSLRNHKLSGSIANFWSISIDIHFRMIYKIQPDGSAYFVDIGTHDQVYKK